MTMRMPMLAYGAYLSSLDYVLYTERVLFQLPNMLRIDIIFKVMVGLESVQIALRFLTRSFLCYFKSLSPIEFHSLIHDFLWWGLNIIVLLFILHAYFTWFCQGHFCQHNLKYMWHENLLNRCPDITYVTPTVILTYLRVDFQLMSQILIDSCWFDVQRAGG